MASIYTLIIPNTARTHVVLVGPAPHWTLPELEFEHPPYWQVVGPSNVVVRERFGLSVTTLRCWSIRHDRANASTRLVYELEIDGSADHEHTAWAWRARDEVADLPPEQQRIVATWFDDATVPAVPVSRVPWYHPGWRDPMRAWLHHALEPSGRALTGAVEQVRSWERASLWRAETTAGVVYFKAVPPMFGHEPALTAFLADQFPTLVPAVLSVEVEHRWLVLAEAGGVPLMHVPAIARWEDALRAYAGMQIALAHQVDAVHALGVPQRSLAWVRAGLERLLADAGTLSAGPNGLSSQELKRLQAAAPALRVAIARMERSGLPLTLEHGDFSPWQIQSDGERVQFLDWSDSSIASPFFSMLGMLSASAAAFPDVPEVAARLRDVYLSKWTEVLELQHLQDLFAVAQQVAPLHHALIYYLDILPSMEQRWEMELMLPYFVRLLL